MECAAKIIPFRHGQREEFNYWDEMASEVKTKIALVGEPAKKRSDKNNSLESRVSSFFAGIGGFDRGFELAGARPVFHCEIKEFCQAVLKAHWPNTPLAPDITTLNADDIPSSDVWCGGFPCQDVSLARGSHGRDGLKGKNSGLFFSFLKLVAERKPTVIVLENVTGLLNSHEGHDFKQVISSLTELGYGVAWRVLNSRYFGVPQSRPRVYVCAWLGNPAAAVNALFETVSSTSPGKERTGFMAESRVAGTNAIVSEVSYCLAATSGRHTGTDWSRTYVSYPNRVRRLVPRECEALQGFPSDWTAVNWGRDEDDLDNVRYEALGNAVTVNVVRWIAERIISSKSSRALMQAAAEDWLSSVSQYLDFYPKAMKRSLTRIPSLKAIKWMSGGCAFGDEIYDFTAPSAPAKRATQLLSAVVERIEPHARYFLSANAATGILRRVESQNRTLFGPLDTALRGLAGAPPKKSKDAARKRGAKIEEVMFHVQAAE